jgi:hypothetical protein
MVTLQRTLPMDSDRGSSSHWTALYPPPLSVDEDRPPLAGGNLVDRPSLLSNPSSRSRPRIHSLRSRLGWRCESGERGRPSKSCPVTERCGFVSDSFRGRVAASETIENPLSSFMMLPSESDARLTGPPPPNGGGCLSGSLVTRSRRGHRFRRQGTSHRAYNCVFLFGLVWG